MKTIYKYQLEVMDTQWLELPCGYKILSLDVQNEIPCIWVQIDTEAEATDSIMIVTVGTGYELRSDNMKFLGTYLINGGAFVGHVFLP